MSDWMRTLAEHYAAARRRFPDDDLMVVFDIDGTILDMRQMVRHVLLGYDKRNGTEYFYGLCVEDVDVHENRLEPLLVRLGLADGVRRDVLRWYLEQRWTSAAILASHRPFQGVMDIIRWFQLQPGTYVGLNTGRPDAIRRDTLESLNSLGREYRVRFDDELLHMNPGEWEQGVQNVKVRGLRAFREQGFRVIAVVDNEPSNLEAMAEADPAGEILFLHAETLFESARREIPRSVGGSSYDITGLVTERDVPRHVQLVWQGVDDGASLAAFLGSTVHWGACTLRRDPLGRVVLRRRSFEEESWRRESEDVLLEDCLRELLPREKGFEAELESAELIDDVLASVERFPEERMCFIGSVESLGEQGFRRIHEALPAAVLQCPVDFLCPLLLGVPDKAREFLEMLRRWGVSRFSLSWEQPAVRKLFEQLCAWGYDANLRDVPDLEGFLQAALLLPRSLTASFDSPGWRQAATPAALLHELPPPDATHGDRGPGRRLVSSR
jgi:hypothetical protein